MNRLASPFACLSLVSIALLLAIGCSTTANQTPGDFQPNDVGGGLDASPGADGAGSDTNANPDTSGQTDDAQTSIAQPDAAQPGDATATVADALADTAGDSKSDGTITDSTIDTSDAKQDIQSDGQGLSSDTTTPKCLVDKECKGSGFGDCLSVGCNVASGKCELNSAASGKVCVVTGPCGGSGTCKTGACNFTSSCAAQPCTPQAVKCGDKLTLSADSFGPSVLGNYGCSATKWDGGEKVLSLSSDSTSAVVVTVTLSGDSSPSAMLFDIGSPAGSCDPGTCSVTGTKLTLGLPVGVNRTVVVDTIKGASGAITVTITCASVTSCGDGACNGTETQNNCPKDCGSALATCGNGQCDAETETCLNCAGDCDPCPAECKSDGSKGCAGCACEACVCNGPIPGGSPNGDGYCCLNAWDSICVSECGLCGGPKCPKMTATCGDNQCDFSEDGIDCPNDCPPPVECGDGVCAQDPTSQDPQASESCGVCAQDCGVCTGPSASCGDAKCNANEQCATCPVDCGQCSKSCGEPTGCGGCACEAQVCAADPYCCNTKWDSICVSACKATGVADGGVLICPVDKCGDGYCSGEETCDSCSKDCGVCPAVCGNGECDPGEDKSNCAKDCSIGCEGKCGKSSSEASGAKCWCDEMCAGADDCCSDKDKFCSEGE